MKLLVIGNHCLSQSESNGRMLRALLSAFPNDALTSFAIRGNPDCIGVNYVTVTDNDALKAAITFSFRKPKGIQLINVAAPNASGGHRKTAFNHYVRSLIWGTGLWCSGNVKETLFSTNYDAIFLMGADTPFLYDLAVKASKKTSTPLVIYTAEDYPLKQFNYIEQKLTCSLWCRLFLKKLNRSARAAFQHARATIFNSIELMNAYKQAFGLTNIHLVYLPASSTISNEGGSPDGPIVYAGNLSPHRVVSLMEVAKALQELSSPVPLTIYGPVSDEGIKAELSNTPGVDYKGVVPYRELMGIYAQARMLIHAEGFDDFYRLDCAHAFSTKIGDCLCSRIPFFLYAPEEMPSSQFMKQTNPDFYASNEIEMRSKLKAILEGKAVYHPDFAYIDQCFGKENVGKQIQRILVDATKSN